MKEFHRGRKCGRRTPRQCYAVFVSVLLFALPAGSHGAARPAPKPNVIQLLREAKPNRFELYHLGRDPGQTRDVAGENPEVFERLTRQLIALHREIVDEGFQWDIPATDQAEAPRRGWNSR